MFEDSSTVCGIKYITFVVIVAVILIIFSSNGKKERAEKWANVQEHYDCTLSEINIKNGLNIYSCKSKEDPTHVITVEKKDE